MSEQKKELFLSIIMPALNEEANISAAIDDTLVAFDKAGLPGEIVVVNDGSSDRTADITKEKQRFSPDKIVLVEHTHPIGMGASFWDGVSHARGDAVCLLPGDNENDPYEIMRYVHLLYHVDCVVPFVFNKKTRSRTRNFLSFLFISIINASFCTRLNYTNGTVLYRKVILSGITSRVSGFFFQTDILIRLIKAGYLYAEVPYRLRTRQGGEATSVSWRSLRGVIKGYLRLVKDIYFLRGIKHTLHSDSLSAQRYNDA